MPYIKAHLHYDFETNTARADWEPPPEKWQGYTPAAEDAIRAVFASHTGRVVPLVGPSGKLDPVWKRDVEAELEYALARSGVRAE